MSLPLLDFYAIPVFM